NAARPQRRHPQPSAPTQPEPTALSLGVARRWATSLYLLAGDACDRCDQCRSAARTVGGGVPCEAARSVVAARDAVRPQPQAAVAAAALTLPAATPASATQRSHPACTHPVV